jgi:prevent-host-death family protein
MVFNYMMQISAADFKTQCLKLMDLASEQGEIIVITKRGIPVAKLLPYEDKTVNLFGFMQGRASIRGDIISPIEEEWDVDSDPS